MLGHVTSSYFSSNLNRSIALAMVKDGGKRIGETLWVSQKDGDPIPVRVSETDFLALAEKGEIGETGTAGVASDD
jgi:sarcosine oxidase subunit alpha